VELKKFMKRIGTISFETSLYSCTGGSIYSEIDELMEWLVEKKGEGATHLEWDGETDYEGCVEEVFIECYVEYEETFEQARQRVDQEEKAKAGSENIDLEKKREEYERLKLIFENCGYDKSLSALTFHHKNPENKEFNIGPALTNKPKNIIKKELQKCDLLCFNCHMEKKEKIRRE